MAITYELVATDPARHPLTGDKKIAQEIACLNPTRFSAGTIHLYLSHIRELYTERPPEVVAPLAQHLLSALLRMDAVRASAIEEVLDVIKERGLWVEPAESAGGRAPGIEPAETYEEFVARNKLTAAQLADRERRAAEATVAKEGLSIGSPVGTGAPGPGRGKKTGYNCNSFSDRERGNGSSYLLAKLARDRPDVLDRWKAGEFRSVRAACLAAGIIKPQPQLVLTKDPFSSAQRIQEQRDQDWIDDLIKALSPGGVSATDRAGDVRSYLEQLPPDRLRYVLSSLCSARPLVFEQLLDDMADEDGGQLDLPIPQADPSAPVEFTVAQTQAPPSSNGNGKEAVTAGELRPGPEPGFYSASALAQAIGCSPRVVSNAAGAGSDGEQILKRTTANFPIKVVVRKGNPRSERYEVLPR